jgi:hypothetical protein
MDSICALTCNGCENNQHESEFDVTAAYTSFVTFLQAAPNPGLHHLHRNPDHRSYLEEKSNADNDWCFWFAGDEREEHDEHDVWELAKNAE